MKTTTKSSLLQILASSKIDHDEIEEDVSDRLGSYKGLQPEALYNSLEDFVSLFNSGYVQGRFLDLGCGTGVSCLTYVALFPEREAIGIEFEASRLRYGNSFIREHNVANIELIEGDLLIAPIPDADTYLLYFPTGHILDRVLDVLYHKNKKFRLVVIESHGDLVERVCQENWLTEIGKIPLFSQRHNPNIFIFERNSQERDSRLVPFQLSFKRKYLWVQDKDEEWVGETYRMEWSSEQEFDLLLPPRRISWNQVKSVHELSDFPEEVQEAISNRYHGVKFNEALIRKIFIKPTFALELSTGERVSLGKGSL